jgi:hypothetical protein
MKWVTYELVHFDRIATPWLILRFLDPDAEFFFVPWGKEDQRPADATPFGMVGVELSSHDKAGTTFQKVLTRYGLSDPGLADMAALIDFGVKLSIQDLPPPKGDRRGQIVEGVHTVTEAIMLSSKSDLEAIEHMLPVFDGLYAIFMAEHMMYQRDDAKTPPNVGESMWRTMFISSIAQRVRKNGGGYDGRGPFEQDEAFESLLQTSRRYLTDRNPNK